ncbi:hypothetical protein GALL_550490 [mine drainage metagenome]|uniref:Uncharacterized protein n=1 Tax=mine drainage metagenome TaxID=410659 RepID=A0A1J5PDW0_9ZZZZ
MQAGKRDQIDADRREPMAAAHGAGRAVVRLLGRRAQPPDRQGRQRVCQAGCRRPGRQVAAEQGCEQLHRQQDQAQRRARPDEGAVDAQEGGLFADLPQRLLGQKTRIDIRWRGLLWAPAAAGMCGWVVCWLGVDRRVLIQTEGAEPGRLDVSRVVWRVAAGCRWAAGSHGQRGPCAEPQARCFMCSMRWASEQ